MKQKNIEKTTSTTIEETINNKVSSTTGGIRYTGNITVSIQRGNKIISTKQYHNNGTALLFKFIANCLAGNYYYKARPCRIRCSCG